MANFEIPENPQFVQELRKFQTSDPGHADVFNKVIQVLLENEVYLFKNTGKGSVRSVQQILRWTKEIRSLLWRGCRCLSEQQRLTTWILEHHHRKMVIIGRAQIPQ